MKPYGLGWASREAAELVLLDGILAGRYSLTTEEEGRFLPPWGGKFEVVITVVDLATIADVKSKHQFGVVKNRPRVHVLQRDHLAQSSARLGGGRVRQPRLAR